MTGSMKLFHGWSIFLWLSLACLEHVHCEPKVENSEVLRELGLELENEAPVSSVSAVQGSSVDLPCNITAPLYGDKVRLVLWFKNESALPIYTFDTREKSFEEARHWSSDEVLGGRAFFRGDHDPGRLVLDNVQDSDQAIYKCRVDFRKAPTRMSDVQLNVIVPPEKPRIFTHTGKEVRLKLGPYHIGDSLRMTCEAYGGRPLPRVTWWRDHALLDDSDELLDSKVANELVLNNLKREDLHTIFTCQASNNNISVPVSTSVKLDMHFGPTEVGILNPREPLSANKLFEIQCRSVGARPTPVITWWLGGKQIRDGISFKTSPDGNVTISTLALAPNVMDAGSLLACRAGSPSLADAMMEDAWKLEIHYVPSSTLTLGSNLNASNIKEGDDVYFECAVKASPRPYKISWKHNGKELAHDIQKKVIISNQSLVLQKVTRSDSGVYTCTAHNAEGDGESNPLSLDIRYKPFCKPDQVQVYGVAKREKIRVSCDVISNPSVDLKFEWVFNSSSERLDLQENLVEVRGTRSLAHHIPQTEMDYGSLMCWATNSIGRQEDPCIFHLIPAGKPDPVQNCTVKNQTYSTLHITCIKGFDGGLPQGFVMEVMDAKSHFIVANTTNLRDPAFTVTGLHSGTGYIVSVNSYNSKGHSEPMRIHAFTTKAAAEASASDQTPKTGESSLTRMGQFTVTPILAILLIVGGALVLVFLIMSVYFCFRRNPNKHHRNRMNYTDTHIPLQKGIDDCIDGNAGSGVGGGMLMTTTANNALLGESKQNPDVVPNHVRTLDEDGGFGVYGDKTLYATLQRQRHAPPATEHDYKTLQHIKNNISSLSQEVTYAELTLPRKQGYTPLKRSGLAGSMGPAHCSQSQIHHTEPVIYARINHNCHAQPPPLLISTSSSGISPNSLLNTSCESSSTCSRGRSDSPRDGRPSSDEGFNSGSSPLGGTLPTPLVPNTQTVALPPLLTPTSSTSGAPPAPLPKPDIQLSSMISPSTTGNPSRQLRPASSGTLTRNNRF